MVAVGGVCIADIIDGYGISCCVVVGGRGVGVVRVGYINFVVVACCVVRDVIGHGVDIVTAIITTYVCVVYLVVYGYVGVDGVVVDDIVLDVVAVGVVDVLVY